jgi:hypothetical protein
MTVHKKAGFTLSGFVLFFLVGVGFVQYAAIIGPFDTIKQETEPMEDSGGVDFLYTRIGAN